MKKATLIFTSGKVSKISFDRVECLKVVNKSQNTNDDIQKVKLSVFYQKDFIDPKSSFEQSDKDSLLDTLAVIMLTNQSDQYVKFYNSEEKTAFLIPLNYQILAQIEFEN